LTNVIRSYHSAAVRDVGPAGTEAEAPEEEEQFLHQLTLDEWKALQQHDRYCMS